MGTSETVRAYRRLDEILPRHWMEDDLVANGIRQHYYRTGGGKPPVVLLHGIMESALSWVRTAKALENDYDVVMVDARGHGRSERMAVAGDYTQTCLTEDVAGFIRGIGLHPTRLVGFSQGAGTAIHLADVHPNLVRSVVAAGMSEPQDQASVDPSASPGYQSWLSRWRSWLEFLSRQTHEERMVASLEQLMPGQPLPDEEQYVAWVESSARLDLDLVDRGPTLWADVPEKARIIKESLARLACPVLVMKSGMWPTPGQPVTVKEEPSDRPNVTVLRFENAGHTIDRDCFEPFIERVREFLHRFC